MIRRLAWGAVPALCAAGSAAAQHQGHAMPGMTMPPAPAPKKPAAKPRPVPQATTRRRATPRVSTPTPARRRMDMGSDASRDAHGAAPAAPMQVILVQHGGAGEHAGHAMPGMTTGDAASAPMPGDAPAPPVPADHYADRFYAPAAMRAARETMMREHGGLPFYQLLGNIAEYRAGGGRGGYRWDGEAWIGGDLNRAVVTSEGAGSFGEPAESAEVQALYSRAVGPYFDAQAGVRHDFSRGQRTYATIGVEGLAPYMFHLNGALFLSTRGEALARVEGWYDQRITQRLVLQPRVEFNLSAQNVAATRTGAGLAEVEAGLRLRYEITRSFAPYLGLSHEARTGRTARMARAAGEAAATTSLVAGIRFWF